MATDRSPDSTSFKVTRVQHSSPSPGVSRRKLLIGGASLLGYFTFAGPTLAWARAFQGTPLHQRFMELSGRLINHRLDEGTGLRIAAFAAQKYAGLAERVERIIAIADERDAQEVEQFFDDIPEEDRELAYWIIAAWYSGASSGAPDAEQFTFEHALTYQTTLDIVPIPTYAFSAPNGWARAPAPLLPVPRF